MSNITGKKEKASKPSYNIKHFTLNIKIIFTITLFFLAVFPLFCRDITVTVIDSDLDLPLEGARVLTRDGAEYICDANGRARLQAPDDRQIIVHATYPGYENGMIIVPVTGNTFTITLRLAGVLQGHELVIEAARPGTNESRTGRSVAVNSREISQTAEIGIVEDVMSTISLLPGVSYSGVFDAQPSIRGGYPGDMNASLDGFYIYNPYFWGGGFSIFDPHMVQSAQLSHGVFSTRYGHTISGLLDITSKKPSPTETQFELGVNTSVANFSLSLPFNNKGGILLMGRVTYYDPLIFLAKQITDYVPELEIVNYIRTAPYIRTATITGNYRFTDNLEFAATGFFGVDGLGAYFANSSNTDKLHSDTTADIDFVNYQAFLTSSLSWNPRTDMLLRFMLGAGFEDRIIGAEMVYQIHNKYFSDNFSYKPILPLLSLDTNMYQYSMNGDIEQSDLQYNIQGRLDYDWTLSKNILIAAGVQEMFAFSRTKGEMRMPTEKTFKEEDEYIQQKIREFLSPIPIPESEWSRLLLVSRMREHPSDTENYLLTTSGYTLAEFSTNANRFKAELGVRLDHFILFGDGFTLQSDPVLNPRLNLDLNILRNAGIFNSIDVSAGTGLFSSVSDAVYNVEERYKLDYIKPNRSWTSVLGIKFEFPESLTLNIEGYYKYIFDRTYIMVSDAEQTVVNPHFDGEGIAWGIDVMLHKVQSRYWDGWLSYSFSWVKYHDPQGKASGTGLYGGNRGDDWYFPTYHRFHNLNLVLSIRPVPRINIFLRFGIASGVLLSRRVGDGPLSYPVLIYKGEDGKDSYFIEKFYWPSVIDENNRTTPSFPMDVKLSFYGNNNNGKTRFEFYVAVENLLSLLYTAQGNTSVNQYTGEVDEGSTSANYEIPIPVPSFGFRISY
ncbi:MAG: TonB-dependent receptor plug domain-containing protein [Treponema sp.]|nr:TonB-dependent receptor plug domain-containing protein [Treponema sp.]